jgi:REP element-mobilizing transposase RayT
MKWKNVQRADCAYFISTTFKGFMPLFKNKDVREIVYQSMNYLRGRDKFDILAYVLMPEHFHWIIFKKGLLDPSKIMGDLKKFTARRILNLFNDEPVIGRVFIDQSYKDQKYSVWKETYRGEVIYHQRFLKQKIDYLHANPVRRRLVKNITDWADSSAGYYVSNKPGPLALDPWPSGIPVSA